jgi:hypothetical protein
MRKKKLLLAGVATVATIGMCISMTACGETAESIVSDEVTTAEATEALSSSNFTNCKVEGTYVMDLTMLDPTSKTVGETQNYKSTADISMTYVDDKIYLEMKLSGDALEKLGEKVKTSYSLYINSKTNEVYQQNDEGKWEVKTYSSSDIASISSIVDMMNVNEGIVPSESDFSNFTYDADKKGYVFTETDSTGNSYEEIIKFKDGKLAALIADVKASNTLYSIDYTMEMLITYGGQSITLPTVE